MTFMRLPNLTSGQFFLCILKYTTNFFSDKICEYKSIGVEFMHPQEKCKVCRCEVYGSIVAPVCKKGSMQECKYIKKLM